MHTGHISIFFSIVYALLFVLEGNVSQSQFHLHAIKNDLWGINSSQKLRANLIWNQDLVSQLEFKIWLTAHFTDRKMETQRYRMIAGLE